MAKNITPVVNSDIYLLPYELNYEYNKDEVIYHSNGYYKVFKKFVATGNIVNDILSGYLSNSLNKLKLKGPVVVNGPFRVSQGASAFFPWTFNSWPEITANASIPNGHACVGMQVIGRGAWGPGSGRSTIFPQAAFDIMMFSREIDMD